MPYPRTYNNTVGDRPQSTVGFWSKLASIITMCFRPVIVTTCGLTFIDEYTLEEIQCPNRTGEESPRRVRKCKAGLTASRMCAETRTEPEDRNEFKQGDVGCTECDKAREDNDGRYYEYIRRLYVDEEPADFVSWLQVRAGEISGKDYTDIPVGLKPFETQEESV